MHLVGRGGKPAFNYKPESWRDQFNQHLKPMESQTQPQLPTMASTSNQFPVPSIPCSMPLHTTLTGTHVQLLPMHSSHAPGLYSHLGGLENSALYTYLFYGPFSNLADFQTHIDAFAAKTDPQFYTIQNIKTGELVGQISHLRIDPTHRVIEIGHVLYSPSLQRTVAATEAFYLLASHAFTSGYRRLEWKCDNANAASRRAAIRLGHVFEGVFRQHMIIKGRNRDSAWFSILDGEWPARKEALERWMESGNFGEDGRQRRGLEGFMTEVEEERLRKGEGREG